MDGQGKGFKERSGEVRSGVSGMVEIWHGFQGWHGRGLDGRGEVWRGAARVSRQGRDGKGFKARSGEARSGVSGLVEIWLGFHGSAWSGMVWKRVVRQC